MQDGSEHQWTIERLGAYARNSLGGRDRARLDDHLAECARCTIVAGEAQSVGSRLALVLLPLTLGSVGAAGYLAALQGGGAPLTVALAAMPSAVTQGAVVVGAGAVGAGGTVSAGGAVGSGGAAGSGAAGVTAASTAGATATAAAAATTATTATATGIFSGVGGTIALVTAGIVLAGGVTSAAILPGMFGEQHQSLAATELPLTAPSDDMVAAPIPEAPLPSMLPDESTAEIVIPLDPPASARQVAPGPPPAERSTPVPPLEPSVSPSVDPGTPPVPTLEPAEPPAEPTDPPAEPTEPPAEPTDPPLEPEIPAVPAGAPVVESAQVVSLSAHEVGIELWVSGEVGAQVDALFFGSSLARPDGESERDVRASDVVDASGNVRLHVNVTYAEFLFGSLRMQYVDGEASGELSAPVSLFSQGSLPVDPALNPVTPGETPGER